MVGADSGGIYCALDVVDEESEDGARWEVCRLDKPRYERARASGAQIVGPYSNRNIAEQICRELNGKLTKGPEKGVGDWYQQQHKL